MGFSACGETKVESPQKNGGQTTCKEIGRSQKPKPFWGVALVWSKKLNPGALWGTLDISNFDLPQFSYSPAVLETKTSWRAHHGRGLTRSAFVWKTLRKPPKSNGSYKSNVFHVFNGSCKSNVFHVFNQFWQVTPFSDTPFATTPDPCPRGSAMSHGSHGSNGLNFQMASK